MNSKQQTVGLVGSGQVAAAVARRLAEFCEVVAFDPQSAQPIPAANVVFSAQPHGVGALGAALPRGTTIVDLMPGDPASSQNLAKDLAERGVALVDAPIHCEHMGQFPESAAILCGASAASLATIMPLLERLCPKVVVCGDVGAGHAARAVVAALAVCNRLVAYECAAVGLKNGLTVSDMATVLTRGSGASSATARVLPALAEGYRTSDALLADIAAELAIGSQLARRVGAPTLIANQALNQVLGASRALGPGATLDDLRTLVEVASDVRFTP